MWDSVLDEWRTVYGPCEEPKLQMKLQRGVYNHAIWPEAEVSLYGNHYLPSLANN